MILIIDNYDSFVYNLAQYVGELGWEPLVFRNDQITLEEIAGLRTSHIIISPGPALLWNPVFPMLSLLSLLARFLFWECAWVTSVSAMSLRQDSPLPRACTW
jgi:hypothetical protein